MKKSKIITLMLAIFCALSLIFVINNRQSNTVNAATFKKATVPKRFRGTWYGYSYNGKLKAFKITRSRINLAGYADSNIKARTYKYTNKAHNSHSAYSSHQLIKTKGNRMLMSYPMGETASAYVTNNRKKLYVGVNTWIDTYYKSKSAARKHHKADKKNGRSQRLFKLVWGI